MLLKEFLILFQIYFIQLTFGNNFNSTASCGNQYNEDRFDCHPERGASEQVCIERGCCWSPPSKFRTNSKYLIDVPYCYYPNNFPSYKVVSSQKLERQSRGHTEYVYSLQKEAATFRPNEILKLEARIVPETQQRLRVQIVDPNNPKRYQVPTESLNFRNSQAKEPRDTAEFDFQIAITENPFSIQVFRKSTGKLVFDTSIAPLIYADQYIEFATSLPVNYFFGIGEHRDNLAHKAVWKSFTMWNRDVPPSLNTNLYGTHPFYLTIDDDSNAFGFYLLNSNGMDINVQPYPALTFITIGGIIDFYIYMGPTPQDVISQHTEIIGRPIMPQYFTLGFHLCRWKYNNSSRLREVINRNRKAGIPYDTQWTDIDGMNLRMDWTYDNVNFAGLPSILEDLHDHDQHYVNIIDPAISNTQGYYPYESGLENDVFIKNELNDDVLVGEVWPGPTVFPDFTCPKAVEWWKNVASKFHESIPFDGIWIDMNEPSNFVDGSSIGCPNTTLDNPPYIPRVLGDTLYAKTICPSSKQHISNHYNLHNMYGHFEAIATYEALKSIYKNKRPFVLTRSSFAGTGQYAAHWSGDNRAQWDDLYYSIPIMLNFNMFGVSQVGSDICGFEGNTNEELCIRWMQLGSFYPFMRNHNDDTSIDQDPAAFSKYAQDIMKKYLYIRYSLLPYLYTLFYRSHVFGETVVRPLVFEFPKDKNTRFIDEQFMFGPSILVSPVLYQGARSVDAYFPPSEAWYAYETGELVNTTNEKTSVRLDAPLDVLNIHIRAGHIVPYQMPAVTTAASRKNPFGLLVGLDQSSKSYGSLFWDDGESLDSIDSKNYNLFNFTAEEGKLNITRLELGYNSAMSLEDLIIYGVQEKPTKVVINSVPHLNFLYDDIFKVLKILYFNIEMTKFETIEILWS